jgi:hypothetical protein
MLSVLYDEFHTGGALFVIDSPEKRLLCAVLKRAIEDFLCPERSIIHKDRINLKKHTIRDAEVWLKDTVSVKPGSILWVLEYITSDAKEAHRKVLRMLNDSKSREYIQRHSLTHRVNYSGLIRSKVKMH